MDIQELFWGMYLLIGVGVYLLAYLVTIVTLITLIFITPPNVFIAGVYGVCVAVAYKEGKNVWELMFVR